MEASQRFDRTDSRIAVESNDDGTIAVSKVIGNTGYVRISVEGHEERVAIDDIAGYFGRMDPTVAALLRRFDSDPEFRRIVMADDEAATEAVRAAISEIEHRGDHQP